MYTKFSITSLLLSAAIADAYTNPYAYDPDNQYNKTMLVCDGGAAEIVVDRSAPRKLFILIKDENINNYFKSEMTKVRHQEFGVASENYISEKRLPLFKIDESESKKFAITLGGSPIFSEGDITSRGKQPDYSVPQSEQCYAGPCFSPGHTQYTFVLEREGDKLTVSSHRRPRNSFRCSRSDVGGTYPGCRAYTPHTGYSGMQYADWTFNDCRPPEQ